MVIIQQAEPRHAGRIAEIHLAARRDAMPWLRPAFSDAETRQWFAGSVGRAPAIWRIARGGRAVVGYIKLDGGHLEHLYVAPGWQRRGAGTRLLQTAQDLSPGWLRLSTFERNIAAKAFYEAHGFRQVGSTTGENEEHEPDVQYAWEASGGQCTAGHLILTACRVDP